MSSLGLKACSLSSGSFEEILEGKFNIIIDTPESWLNDSRWKSKVLSSAYFRRNVVCVVVDEAHKVSWGAESDTGVFREAFSRIGEKIISR